MTKSEFKQAFSEAVALDYVDIPEDEAMIDITFSNEFLSQMDRLISDQKKIIWNMMYAIRRNVAMIAIIILGMFVTACGVTQIIYLLHEDIYNENVEEIEQNGAVREIEYVYKIYELPEGFEKVSLSKGIGFRESTYRNESGCKILFLQTTNAEFRYILSEEEVIKETEVIENREVDIYKNNDLIGAIWVENGYYMEILYYGCEDIEDIRNIILSVK